LDLTTASEAIEAACLSVFGITGESGQDLPSTPLDAFIGHCRATFEALAVRDESEALHFVTLISAFIHECRHVHDLRGTRIGAELLLADIQTYARLPSLIQDLQHWLQENPEAVLFLPLRSGDFDLLNLGPTAKDHYAHSLETRARMQRLWSSKSRFRILPGTSIKDLYEVLGFEAQIDFVSGTYGNDIAKIVADACLGGDAARAKYLRPMEVLVIQSNAHGVRFDPGAGDMSRLVTSALNMCGLDEAFDADVPGDRHPGAWFDRLAEIYVRLAHAEKCPSHERAEWAAPIVAEWELGTDLTALYQRASQALDEAQKSLLADLIGRTDLELISPAVLIATEIAIDFRQGQRIMFEQPEYHSPMGYLSLLVGGELTRVYVRANTRSMGVIDFRMPSEIPTNHVGGARSASAASQQIRLMMTGRRFDGGFLQEQAYRELLDPAIAGLRFRQRRAARKTEASAA
jgi:hypothetical protein